MERLEPHQYGELQAVVDELFLESDREVIRILSKIVDLIRDDTKER